MRSGTISRLLRRRSSTSLSAKTLSPLEIFTQLQLGIHPPVSAQKSFLMEYCKPQLERRLITEAKLIAMDSKLCEDMLRGFLYERYLAVPFRLFTFDMEFTGPPVFTSDGPTQDITEIGIYSPARECTFDTLVQPCCGRRQSAEVEKLTNIANSELDGATPFPEAWRQFLEFAHTPEPNELPGSEKRILLLSHGGKLADVSLIKWTVDKFKLPLPESFVFGDTVHLIRDAHRRRPVTIDKHPPSWSLLDLIQWLKVEPTLPAHRAGNDAKMTWDALYHTLLRYGEENMTPREQLIPRFFDEEAKKRMSADMFKNARLQETDLDTLNSINSVGFVNNAYNEITDNDNNADTTVSTTQNISSNNSYEYYNRGVERKMLNEFDEDSYAVADLPHHRQVVQESNDDNESAIFDLNFDEIFSRSEETNTEHEHQSLQEHSNKQNDELKFSEEEYEYEHTSAADAAAKATSILSKALHNEPIKLTGHVANEISHDNNGNNEIDTFNISFTDIDSNVNVEVSSISYSSENNTVSSVSSKSKTKTDTQEDAVVAAVVVVEKADKTNHALDKTKQKNNKRKMKEHVKEKGVSKTKSGKTKQKRKTEHPQEEHKVQPVVLDL